MLCWSVPCTQHLLHVCPSLETDPITAWHFFYFPSVFPYPAICDLELKGTWLEYLSATFPHDNTSPPCVTDLLSVRWVHSHPMTIRLEVSLFTLRSVIKTQHWITAATDGKKQYVIVLVAQKLCLKQQANWPFHRKTLSCSAWMTDDDCNINEKTFDFFFGLILLLIDSSINTQMRTPVVQ